MVSVGNDAQWRGQCEFTICYHEAAPYQIPQAFDMCGRLPNLTGSCARGAKPHGGFGLVWNPLPRLTIGSIWLWAGRQHPLPIITTANKDKGDRSLM